MTGRLSLFVALLCFSSWPSAVATQAADPGETGPWLRQVLSAACPAGLADPEVLAAALGAEVVAVEDRGPARRRLTLADSARGGLTLTTVSRGDALASLTIEASVDSRPVMMLRADGNCSVILARAIAYDDEGRADALIHLDGDLAPSGIREPLNPPVPDGRDPGGVMVVQVDSGVNYLLPEIAARLARDPEGVILGYDFWELDKRPFDGNPARSPFFPIRHGTTVASVLLREAPEIRLLPYRYPRPDMSRMAPLVIGAAAEGARIVAMAMGSRNREEWLAFEQAAADHPELLFILSAGNDGRNIDEAPLYPAVLPLDNMLVVTSSDDFGRLAAGSNWGPQSVDLMVPAERVDVIDHRGALGTASGSSYAVPRVAALAARLLARNPDWSAAALRQAILARAVPPRSRGRSPVRHGWIPNPADDG